MSQPRIYVAIPVHGRLPIAERCIPTVHVGMIHGHDMLALYGDGTELPDSLVNCADVIYQSPNIGIERQRRRHFLNFAERMDRMDWTHWYGTDADALHSGSWRSELLRLQDSHNGLPICGYNTLSHQRISGNTLVDDSESEVILRRVAPGVSYLLRREHVEKVVAHLANIPDGHWQWDWTVPAILGSVFAVTRVSVLDHIGHGGYHHPENEGYDGGDRALNPTPDLVEKRAQVVAELKALI